MRHAHVLAIAILLASSPSLADPAADARAVFMHDLQAHVDLITREMPKVKIASTKQVTDRVAAVQQTGERTVALQRAGARANAIDDENVATLPRLAALAFKTDLKGTEAGVTIAPLVLFGHAGERARSLNLSIATLKEGKFRVGASYKLPFWQSAIGPVDLGFKICTLDPAKYQADVATHADDYGVLCAAIAKVPWPSGALDKVAGLRAAAACGRAVDNNLLDEKFRLESGGDGTGREIVEETRDASLTAKVSSVLQFWNAIKPRVPSEAAKEVPDVTIKQLEALRDAPSPWSCIENDAVVKAAIRKRWRDSRTSLGLSVAADFYPYTWGLNPDKSDDPDKHKSLPEAELSKAEARIEVSRSSKRLTWTAGFGVKSEREAIDDDLTLSLRPAAGVQYLMARLDGGPLYEGDSIAVNKDGTLPPTLVLGVDALVSAPVHNKPDYTSRIDEAEVKLFADFRINKDIAFRIGVPFTMAIKTRKEDDKKALQKTISVFVSTVLEL